MEGKTGKRKGGKEGGREGGKEEKEGGRKRMRQQAQNHYVNKARLQKGILGLR